MEKIFEYFAKYIIIMGEYCNVEIFSFRSTRYLFNIIWIIFEKFVYNYGHIILNIN